MFRGEVFDIWEQEDEIMETEHGGKGEAGRLGDAQVAGHTDFVCL